MSGSAPARHALFPGTFDPFTLGHQDLVLRARNLFGRVTVGIAVNPEKRHLFESEARIALIREATRGEPGVEVCAIEGLLIDACASLGCEVVVRGVRSGTDFDYEVQMARTNRYLSPGMDTVLLVPDPATAHVSSTLVRQIAAMGGDVSSFVPPCVARELRARFPAS